MTTELYEALKELRARLEGFNQHGDPGEFGLEEMAQAEKQYEALADKEDDESVRCICEWCHPVHGYAGLYPAELDPECEVHGAPAGWPDIAEWCAEYHCTETPA